MLHVCSIFVWIMIEMQWLPLILNGKSTDKALFCLYEEIYFICYLFDLELVLKFQFSFVIYIIFTFCYLAEAFIQSDLQMRRIEAMKTNKRAIICKCYITGADLPVWQLPPWEKAVPSHLPPQNYHRIKYKCKQCFMWYFSAAAMTA